MSIPLHRRLYFDKFGFIFIIFAKGKSSPEILETLKRRYHALPYEELQAAAREQMKITELRLGQLFGLSAELELQKRAQRRTDQVLNQVTRDATLFRKGEKPMSGGLTSELCSSS